MGFRERRHSVSTRSSFQRLTLLALLSATALFTTAIGGVRARDFEMGGDGNYNIMVPEPGTGSHHAARSRHGRTSRHHSRSLTATQRAIHDATQTASPLTDTPEQIETFKRNRRAAASRGSSGLVLPTPLPGPTHYAPTGPRTVTLPNLPQEQGPTILPGTGRAIPNLPHGAETFQDRASRCAFQASINSVPGGQMSSYMHNCAM
jgi:hypothetical protein